MKSFLLLAVLASVSVQGLPSNSPLRVAEDTIITGVDLSNKGVKFGTEAVYNVVDRTANLGDTVVTKVEEFGTDALDKGTELAKSALERTENAVGKIPVVGGLAAAVTHHIDSGVDHLDALAQSGIGMFDMGASGILESADHYGKELTQGIANGFNAASEAVVKLTDSIFDFFG